MQKGYPAVSFLPLCPICKYHISSKGGEMHEALVTRGNIQGTAVPMQEIMTAENCVIVHPQCHKKAHSTRGRQKCADYLAQWEEQKSLGWTLFMTVEYPHVSKLIEGVMYAKRAWNSKERNGSSPSYPV